MLKLIRSRVMQQIGRALVLSGSERIVEFHCANCGVDVVSRRSPTNSRLARVQPPRSGPISHRVSGTGGSYNVVSTRDVKEINDGQGYPLDVKADFSELESFRLSVAAWRARPPQKTHFTITVKGDGTYVVKRS